MDLTKLEQANYGDLLRYMEKCEALEDTIKDVRKLVREYTAKDHEFTFKLLREALGL
jgi:hypothetical protein